MFKHELRARQSDIRFLSVRPWDVVIVNRRFFIFIFKYRFWHRYRLKSAGLAPVLENTQTMPIPSHECVSLFTKTLISGWFGI